MESLTTQPYSDLVGARYEVIADDLYAYGIRSPERQLEYVTLIPGVGIGGREIAFKRRIPPGAEITIRSAWHQFQLFDNGVYYLVSVSGADLPSGVQTKIEMFRGNEGTGVDLNTRVYRRLLSERP